MKKNKESCDVCGRQEVFAIVEIEGAKLRVCRPCAYGKKVLYYLEEDEQKGGVRYAGTGRKAVETEEIIDDYGKIIRRAREKLGLPAQVLAEKIKESRSYMEKIEREEIKPTIATAKKLEKELGIKLIEKTVEAAPSPIIKKRHAEPTLEDLLEGGKG